MNIGYHIASAVAATRFSLSTIYTLFFVNVRGVKARAVGWYFKFLILY